MGRERLGEYAPRGEEKKEDKCDRTNTSKSNGIQNEFLLLVIVFDLSTSCRTDSLSKRKPSVHHRSAKRLIVEFLLVLRIFIPTFVNHEVMPSAKDAGRVGLYHP
jgi:hypothetical protein